ncbi:hypothetical protein FOZ62_013655, partial [Perkinsus olseni]
MGRKSTSGFCPWPYVTKTPEAYHCDIGGQPCYFKHKQDNSTRFERHMKDLHEDLYFGRMKWRRPRDKAMRKQTNGVRLVESVTQLYNYEALPNLHVDEEENEVKDCSASSSNRRSHPEGEAAIRINQKAADVDSPPEMVLLDD